MNFNFIFKKKAQIKKYVAKKAPHSYQALVHQTATSFQNTFSVNNMANNLSLYNDVIVHLKMRKKTDFLSLNSFASANIEAGNTFIAFRHDVDIALDTAVECARMLARHGIPGIFFLLHTAYYYGTFDNGCFLRNPAMEDYIKKFIIHGAELGLHTDPIGVYSKGIDGAESVKCELEWLRKKYAVIRGTVAHNSAPANGGAENFEIFKGRSDREYFIGADGLKIPLQVLDEKELGLEYEANFPLIKPLNQKQLKIFMTKPGGNSTSSQDWMKTYLTEHPIFDRKYDATVWLNGRDKWIVAQHETTEKTFHWNITTTQMLELIENDSFAGKKIIFVWHPCYLCK